MELPILIERIADNGFRATDPFGLEAEGVTEAEAIERMQSAIRSRNFSEAVVYSLPIDGHIHKCGAGVFSSNDPMVLEWLAIMAENRRLADEIPIE